MRLVVWLVQLLRGWHHEITGIRPKKPGPSELFVKVRPSGDPLAWVLLTKLRLTPIEVLVMSIALGLVDVFVLSSLAGYFESKGGITGAIEDIEYLITFLVAIPVIQSASG